MAGPSITILLPNALPLEQVGKVEEVFRNVGFAIEPPDQYILPGYVGSWDGYLRDATSFHLTDYRPCLMGVSVHEMREHSEDELDEITDAIGYRPIQAIGIYVMCNRPQDHRLLAELTLIFVATFGGWIDLHGVLEPPQQYAEYPHWDGAWPDDIEPALNEIWQYVSSFPGQVRQIRYQTGGGYTWVHHIVDETFLRAWLASPNFHLIK